MDEEELLLQRITLEQREVVRRLAESMDAVEGALQALRDLIRTKGAGLECIQDADAVTHLSTALLHLRAARACQDR